MTTIFGNIDTGEMAARLGSIDTFERRGNVVLMETFEGPALQWIEDLNGDGAAANLSISQVRAGGQSCKLTAGEGVNGMAHIYRIIGALVTGRLGVETTFTLNADTKEIRYGVDWYDGTHVYNSLVMYDLLNKRFEYKNADGDATPFLSDIELLSGDDRWHVMKFVVDTATNKFVRFMADNISKDMTGMPIYIDDSDTLASIDTGISHISNHASVKSIYIDNFIVTQNEP